MAVQATAAARGLTLSTLRASYEQFSGGSAITQATGADLQRYHDALRAGADA
jgi:hypothetical protein